MNFCPNIFPRFRGGLVRIKYPKKDMVVTFSYSFANMDPVDLIIHSLDVKGAFWNTPWLLPEASLETPRHLFLQLHLQVHPHPQVHSPHRGGPDALPRAGQWGPRRRSRRALPVRPRDPATGRHHRAGLTGLRALPPPRPPGGFCGRHHPSGCTHPTRTPHTRRRTHGHPASQ